MCAATAGYRGRSVLVLDHANKPGKKILMSGGGRCNFTNLNSTPANFLSDNPHYCISALKRYTPQDFLELVDRHGIEHEEKAPGQLFCKDSAKDILNMLLTECEWAGAEVRMKTTVDRITEIDSGYRLSVGSGDLTCESLVIATGGLSIPTMGATAFGYRVAEQFGLDILPTRAGLVPFTLQPELKDQLAPLSGVSCPVDVQCHDQHFREPMLVTHRGLSGPAMLQISSFWEPGDSLAINLLPACRIKDDLLNTRADMYNLHNDFKAASMDEISQQKSTPKQPDTKDSQPYYIYNDESGVYHQPFIHGITVPPVSWATACGWKFGTASRFSIIQT